MHRQIRYAFCFFILTFSVSVEAQQPSVGQLRETALTFQRQKDYSNTMMILSQALALQPDNIDLLNDVAFTLYLSGDLSRAMGMANALTEKLEADATTFQIACTIFKAAEELKTCEKLYKKGLKRFPDSGPLYSEYGELLWAMEKPSEAIREWENGISLDPSFSGNYYHAAKFYFAAADKVRSIIYGEHFVNLESLTNRASEIKILLLESYKRLYNTADNKQFFVKETSPFEQKFKELMNRQTELALRGITPENLILIRSRFILAWYSDPASNRFPSQLFDRMRRLMRDGMFEAYNQWLFGQAADPNAFNLWATSHEEEMNLFLDFHRNNLFSVPLGQHYF